jgi:hypothetical protein
MRYEIRFCFLECMFLASLTRESPLVQIFGPLRIRLPIESTYTSIPSSLLHLFPILHLQTCRGHSIPSIPTSTRLSVADFSLRQSVRDHQWLPIHDCVSAVGNCHSKRVLRRAGNAPVRFFLQALTHTSPTLIF